MDRQIIDLLYKAFLNRLIVSYSANKNPNNPDEMLYDIVFVEHRTIMTTLYLKVFRGIVDVSIMEEAPRYPVYDSQGNVVYFGV